ncbi:MAG: hypothetical protein ACRDGI_04350 [Candidatus Limnocylindrales bacterium]
MSFLVFGLVLVVATTLFGLGSAYLVGGFAIIRRRILFYALLPVFLLAIVFGIGAFEDATGGDVGRLLVSGLTLVLIVLAQRRRKRLSPETRAANRVALRRPAYQWLLTAYIATIAVAIFLRLIVPDGTG